MATPRDEALRALDHVIAKLAGDEPLEGLERYLVRATAEYARAQVALLSERRRRVTSDGVGEAVAEEERAL